MHSPDDIDKKKRETIALCQRKIKAAVVLYAEGRIDYDSYRKRIDKNEREIAYWNSRTTESEKVAFELAKCIDEFNDIVRLWAISEAEEKQKMARNVFESIVFNLDTRRLVGFKLKPWAEKYVGVRAAWNADVQEVLSKQKTTDLDEFQVGGNAVSPRGFEPIRRYSLAVSITTLIDALRNELYLLKKQSPNFSKRNETIRSRYAQGESLTQLAQIYGISHQRIHQIVHFQNH